MTDKEDVVNICTHTHTHTHKHMRTHAHTHRHTHTNTHTHARTHARTHTHTGPGSSQLVKNPPTMQETLFQFLGWEDQLKNG